MVFDQGTVKATGIYSHNYNSHRTSVDLRMLLNLLCVNYCRELTFHLFVCLSVHVHELASYPEVWSRRRRDRKESLVSTVCMSMWSEFVFPRL